MHRIPRQSYDRSDRKSRYRDRFLGERGKERRKEWLKSEKPWRVTDEEIALMRTRYDQIDPAKIEEFKDFPLSKSTLEGLKHARYTVPTDIQRQSIGLALQGHDILAAAKTGSGKTLAFMIPVLEKLYCLKWSVLDGLGALIISPTRELAYQIFHVMRKIGQAHDFSAGLVIGGKNLKEESELIHKTNIVICTPGRLLQHMDENPTFTADTLQILILDEADRILDLGFEKTMNAIIENFPVTRQTLLFSATQTKSVKDLARLSLKQSLYYVSAHEHAQHSTPLQLTQSYIVCELHDKLTILMSFIKNHLKSKILVFLSTCKQVRYVYQAFCRAQPGVTLLALYGIMKQLKRVEMYNLFWRKQHAVLFATDVAARGLDFPAVHWVIQFDCPDDANTYIHRAGRTARYESNGESLLFLMPSEEAEMLTQLKEKKIPIEKIQVNEKKLQNVQPKLEAQCVADPSLKENAKKAFVSYLRSVVLMSNKKIFDAQKLDTDKFARSLGLAICPRVRFLEREKLRLEEKQKQSLSSSRYDLSGTTAQKSSKSANSEVGTEIDSSKGDNQNESGNDSQSEALSGSGRQCLKEKLKSKNQFDFSIDDVGDNLLTVKRVDTVESEGEQNEQCNVKYLSKNSRKKKSKYAMAKQALKKRITLNTKVDFDDDGNPIKDLRRTAHIQVRADDNYQGGICIKAARKFLEEEDKFDKQLFREQIKKKHKEKYQKMKQKRKEQKSKKQQSSEDEGVTAFVDPSTQDPLSYLPDPDEIYGKSGDEKEREDDSRHKNSDSDDEQHSYYEHPVKRRKTEHVLLSSGEDGDDFEAVMSLRDEEELALQLLKSS